MLIVPFDKVRRSMTYQNFPFGCACCKQVSAVALLVVALVMASPASGDGHCDSPFLCNDTYVECRGRPDTSFEDCEHLMPPCDYPLPFPGCGYDALFEELEKRRQAEQAEKDEEDEEDEESEDDEEREQERIEEDDEPDDWDDEPDPNVTIEEL